ncbi:MAG: archaetidylserine decarboxylase [Pseudomonadales bacterium]|nr:archaetidylserine decarboxylase [Pseudomonadales bacterium]
MSLPEFRERLFILSQYCIPQHTLSRLIGYLADCETPWLKAKIIQLFSHFFPINMTEAERENYEQYVSFNDFFTRELKSGTRPIVQDDNAIASPADGAISEIGRIEKDQLIQAKGHKYSLLALLGGDTELAEQFNNGAFATIYLSPKDYHRVHMPLAGTLQKTLYVPGKLFSVNQATANNVPGLFARNERLVCVFDTDCGPMVVILVGAMIVAAIETVWAGQVAPQSKTVNTIDMKKIFTLAKGGEMGRFKLGSTAIVLFPENIVTWNETLENGSAIQLGELLGTINNS